MSRMPALLLLLHAYIGFRLLPDLPFGAAGVALGIGVLAASAWLIPFGFHRQRAIAAGHAKQLMWAGLVAIGAFSTLLVLTFVRDVGLLAALGVATLLPGDVPLGLLARWSATAVPVTTALLTLIGFFNARRVAPVRTVDVPIDSLHPALHGFTIAQITDMHIGPTIGRDDVEAVVDVVNRATFAPVDSPWHVFRDGQPRVLFGRAGVGRRVAPHWLARTAKRARGAGP